MYDLVVAVVKTLNCIATPALKKLEFVALLKE
jgi:hypothetical protein